MLYTCVIEFQKTFWRTMLLDWVVNLLAQFLLICCQDAEIRLAGSTNEREGRVEILYQGIWGTICDNEWNDIDATVACRQLGFLNGTAAGQTHFGSGSGPVWLSQVDCLGNESKLSDCMHNQTGSVGNCSHAQDAGVQCSANGNQLFISSMHSLAHLQDLMPTL